MRFSSKHKIIVAALVPLILLGCLVSFLWQQGNNVGYAPEQPLPFSHKTHAGDNKIPCQYCHSNADKSRHATVPTMNVCMNCHSVVKTDSPFIQKLTKMYKEGKPLEWIKVHDLPDHVYFSHQRHINWRSLDKTLPPEKQKLDCKNCHGDVEKMEVVEQVETLTMGFCVTCHRKPEHNAPTDCQTCHQ